jgi:predicted ArsR family transcriptional regulator
MSHAAVKATQSTLKRWVALDRELLSADGLDIKEFAARWNVDPKTIRRDLQAFAEAGQTASYKKENRWDGRSRQWRYNDHVKHLFACNLGEAAMKAAIKARWDELLAAKRKARRDYETRRRLRRIPR